MIYRLVSRSAASDPNATVTWAAPWLGTNAEELHWLVNWWEGQSYIVPINPQLPGILNITVPDNEVTYTFNPGEWLKPGGFEVVSEQYIRANYVLADELLRV